MTVQLGRMRPVLHDYSCNKEGVCQITGRLTADLLLMIADSNWNSGEVKLSESMIGRDLNSINNRIHEMALFMGIKNQ
jgi:hypothetical protein